MFSHKLAGTKMERGKGVIVYGTPNSNNNNSEYFILTYHIPNRGNIRCMHARPHRRKDQLPLRSLRDLCSR